MIKLEYYLNHGNTFTFQDNGIYINKSKICSEVTDCKFKKEMQEEKEILVVLFEMKDFIKTTRYVITGTELIVETNFE